MKKLFGFLFAIALSSVAMAQDIKFTTLEHDFGKIKFGVPVTYDFEFQNVGKKPIVIESATAACGCTTPVKPQTPVAAGKSNVIKAGFNAATVGVFDKNILIKVAGIPTPIELKIRGEVLPPAKGK